MTVTVQKDVGSPTNLTVQVKRKVVRVLLEVAANGDHKVSIQYDEWREDAVAVQVGATSHGVKTLLEADLNNAARSDIDAVFIRALNAV